MLQAILRVCVCVWGGAWFLRGLKAKLESSMSERKNLCQSARDTHKHCFHQYFNPPARFLFTGLYFTAYFSSHKNAAVMMCLLYLYMYSVKYIETPVDSRANCLLRIMLNMFALCYNYLEGILSTSGSSHNKLAHWCGDDFALS